MCAVVTAAVSRRTTVLRVVFAGGVAGVLLVILGAVAVGQVPWREVPLVGNYARAGEFAATGRGLAAIVGPREPVAAPGEVAPSHSTVAAC